MVSGRRANIPEEERPPIRPPAKTPEAREQQLVNHAVNLAERQLVDGSASAQVIVHFLKLATEKEKLERKKIEQENLLLAARVDNLNSAATSEELYKNALEAMRKYSGQDDGNQGYDESQHSY